MFKTVEIAHKLFLHLKINYVLKWEKFLHVFKINISLQFFGGFFCFFQL